MNTINHKFNMLTIDDVADKLNVSKRTIYSWVNKGTIPCYRIGQGFRFDETEINNWIENKKIKEND